MCMTLGNSFYLLTRFFLSVNESWIVIITTITRIYITANLIRFPALNFCPLEPNKSPFYMEPQQVGTDIGDQAKN